MTDAARQSSSTTDPPGAASPDKSRMSFGDHLEELRSCLIRALVGVILGVIVCLIFGREILEIIYRPLLIVQNQNDLQPSLQVLSPTAGFIAFLKIGFLSGLILAMPWLIYQIWRFVASGLYGREQRFVRLLIPVSLLLFVAGVMFLYFIVLPVVLNFFISFNKNFDMPDLTPTVFQSLLVRDRTPPSPITAPSPDLNFPVVDEDPPTPTPGTAWVNATTRRLMVNTDSGVLSVALDVGPVPPAMHSQFALDFYISFVLMLCLAFGIAFETPIVVFFLSWSGLVPVAKMVRGRRYVLFGTVIAAAMLTPPDVISQILLAGPMYLLFELGILVARATQRKTAADDE